MGFAIKLAWAVLGFLVGMIASLIAVEAVRLIIEWPPPSGYRAPPPGILIASILCAVSGWRTAPDPARVRAALNSIAPAGHSRYLRIVLAPALIWSMVIGFIFCMRGIASISHAEPLPGRPELSIDTKLGGDWTIVGMNYDWMLLVTKFPVQMGVLPEAVLRWEYTNPRQHENGKHYLSAWDVVQLDCKGARMNIIIIHKYAGNNKSGENIYSGMGEPSRPDWDTPASKSIGAEAIRKACALFTK